MHIIYSVATCSMQVYTRLFAHTKLKPAYQSQKYHRLLIEGLAAHAEVDVVATPPVNRKVMDKAIVWLPAHTEGGARYHHIPAVRNPYLKGLFMGVGTFFKTLCLARRDSVVIVDCLNRVVSTSALLAARLRGRRCVGIVMDLPDMFTNGRKFYTAWGNWVIAHCTDYIVLTEPMNDYINPTGKPHVVLEGQADITMRDREPSMDMKIQPRVVLYAGGVSRQYGAEIMTQGFRKANIPNTQLHIYGPGDYVEELEQIAKQDDRVFYGGMILNTQVVEKEQQATLLINPRPTHEEFVKYSFPSKTMEYMSSGTPALTTRIPGIPKDYEPHLFFIDEETIEGVAQALQRVFSHTDEELFAKGQGARSFILDTRNNVIQAGRILEMLKKGTEKP